MEFTQRLLVTIATYNESENLPSLIGEIHAQVPQADVLVIDDNSPDGTGDWVDEQAAKDTRVSAIHRSGKLGLGSATIEGFQHAITEKYDLVLNLDADFSHHPRYIPALVAGTCGDDQAVDVMIGSRYVAGGGVEGWPLYRRLMSKCVNFYARWMLGLSMRDCSGSFRCYRVALLEKLDFDAFRSQGYSYLEEILWRLKRAGATFGETPIVFKDREFGKSKINMREAVAALWIIFRLGITNWTGL